MTDNFSKINDIKSYIRIDIHNIYCILNICKHNICVLMILAEYSKTTSATQDAIWKTMTDVKSWTEWKESIEYIDLDGPFDNEVTGLVKHSGDETKVFMIKEVVPLHQFVDIYKLPVGKIISCHRIEKLRKNYKITYRIELLGPFSFLIGLILRMKYKDKIKRGIRKLIQMIEKESKHE